MDRLTRQQAAAIAELHRRRIRKDPIYWAETALRFYGEDFRLSACHRLLIDKLHGVAKGEIRKLMIFMPSGSAKTLHTSRIFPTWCLATMPGVNLIAASHNAAFAENKVSAYVQDLMVQFADELGASPTGENKTEWACDNRSTYRAAGAGAGIMGERADIAIIDDPFGSWEDAASETIRNKVYEWYRNTLMSRLKPGGRIVLMHQRLHVDDLAGRLLAEEGDEWEVLFLPAVWEQQDWKGQFQETDELGRKPGDSVWPEYFSPEFLADKQKNIGPLGWASMYQQRPTPTGGALFTPALIRGIETPPESFTRIVRAWDIAMTAPKGGADPDWTVGVLMQVNANDTYTIVDVERFRGGPEEVKRVIVETAHRDRDRYGSRVQISIPQDPGAAGKFMVADLTRALAGFTVSASPESGDKFTRALPFASQVNAGNVTITNGPHVPAYRAELELFPNGKKDDQVDASSRAFRLLSETPTIYRRPGFEYMGRMAR